MSPLRVLIVYDCIYPFAKGGVEHRNRRVAEVLGRRGHRVTLAGFAAASGAPSEGVDVLSLGPPEALYDRKGRRSRAQALRLATAVARLDPSAYDLVETANLPYLHLPVLGHRCRRSGTPLLVNWHAHWGRYWKSYLGNPSWPLFAAIEARAARAGTVAVAVSEMVARRVARDRREAVPVLPNGVPFAAVAAAAAAAPPGAAPVVFAGRMVRERRLHLLIEALARLAAGGLPVSAALVGDGPQRAELEQLRDRLGLAARVSFPGSQESEALWRMLGGARVAVQPSSHDSFGLFPLEALAAGLPVVYCESPDSAVGELVRDGVEGFACRPEPGEMATVLERLLEDATLQARMKDNARRRAAEYDWERIADRVEELYRAVAGRGRNRV